MIDFEVDYHIHTTYSDGALKPVEIVKKRKNEGYDIIAITDHDGIDGIPEALTAGEALEIQVIPGVEISTRNEDDVKIHILGYKFDLNNPQLNEKLNEFKESRKQRNEKLLNILRDYGYDITLDDVVERPGQTYFGKPHFAHALIKKGYAKDKSEVFDVIFERPEIKALRKETITTKDAITLINNAGGMAVIAHPGEIKGYGEVGSDEWKENLSKLLFDLKKSGLKGIECFHPSHGKEEEDFFVGLANKYHLHITKGSDFHEE